MPSHRDFLTKAQQVKRQYHEACTAIRAQRDLSELGKARKLEQAREQLAQQLGQLRAQYDDARAGASEAAHRRLFAPTYQGAMPTETTRATVLQSYRDALSRADAIQSGDAASRAYTRAQRSGDDLMCRALATVAWERGWQTVLNQHAGTSEEARSALEELVTLTSAAASRRVQFDERTTFSLPAVTPEEARHRGELLQAKADARAETEADQQLRGVTPPGHAAINRELRAARGEKSQANWPESQSDQLNGGEA